MERQLAIYYKDIGEYETAATYFVESCKNGEMESMQDLACICKFFENGKNILEECIRTLVDNYPNIAKFGEGMRRIIFYRDFDGSPSYFYNAKKNKYFFNVWEVRLPPIVLRRAHNRVFQRIRE